MSKTIIIKHVTGDYKLPIMDQYFDKFKKGIEECIKGKVPAIVFYDGSGNEQHFPADVLRSSVITFEIVKKNVRLKGGAV
ncbi:hypothetical protein H9Q08_16865 [Chryseobacterium sp. PS-8]|uniref:Uncharacterized protein n=1 Tax=Chryseobacterium indicum TaxID=2766954 RepID=A0ABS9C9H2_9FLAO|nr:hypothetical protein [Chryseobacterium sp. PS-8]MCF2220958.1 hypothetical protein [Chryseobacterium sp. PS-8]